MKERDLKFDTLLLHGGYEVADHQSLVPPIYQSVAYPYENAEDAAKIFAYEKEGFTYGRIDNPTLDILEKRIALLEGGERALSTATGLAAIFMVSVYFAKAGDEIVSSNRIYGGTFELFDVTLRKLGIDTKFVKQPEKIEEWEKMISKNTKFLYLETPSNPTLFVGDIEAIAEVAHSHNIPLIVDNTICTPALQLPFQYGADVIVHSATKYLSGNATALGGIIVGKEEMIIELRRGDFRNIGPSLSPFNAWLLLLSVETLSLRMHRHSENAFKVAMFLEEHPKVKSVNYPGIRSHPQYHLAKKQMKGASSLLSFEIEGTYETGFKFIDSLKLCTHVTHLGTSTTIAVHPASTTHQQMGEKERKYAGIKDTTIRLSIGLENPDDIIEDINQALEKI
jgi:O-acetylhomoserine/O-acetylserine sulfhydrylase-like pyridoxal-dependent enzyme